MMEKLLCRFTRPQRAFIRKQAKRYNMTEAEVVRAAISTQMVIEKYGAEFVYDNLSLAKI